MPPADHAERLKVGLILPQATGELDGQTPGWETIRDIAGVAEDVGFDSIWAVDHLLYREEGQPTKGVWECWSLLSALAAVTSRVTIGSFVTCLAFRNPGVLAKVASTADEISGGRIVLGVGAGWHEPEFEAFGLPFDHRVDRFAEALRIIHSLLRTGHVDFRGAYYEMRDCVLLPTARRAKGPPIMIGSVGPRMLRLAAELADAWNAWATETGNTPEGYAHQAQRVDDACTAFGRGRPIARSVNVMVDLPGRVGEPRDGVPPLTGSSDDIAAGLRRYHEAGADEVQVWLNPLNPSAVASFGDILQRL